MLSNPNVYLMNDELIFNYMEIIVKSKVLISLIIISTSGDETK